MKNRCLACYLPLDIDNTSQRYHESCAKRIFERKKAPIIEFGLGDIEKLAEKVIKSQGAMPGIQPKISLALEKTNRELGKLTIMYQSEYILKPPTEYYKSMPEVEDLTMHLAEKLGIETVPHTLIPLASGELSYITRRIDRQDGKKIHMEDFCQLSELLTEDKYKSSMEKVGKIVGHYSKYVGLDLINLFELTVFNFIVGNNDMHLKNFSLIKDRLGWHFSPAYDLLNARLVNPDDKEESALTIAGKKSNIRRSAFMSLANSYGLNQKQVDAVFEKMVNKRPDFLELIEASFLDDEMKEGYVEILNFGYRALDLS